MMVQYRGDIQIFRAVAVAVVVLFHMGVPGFQSGFLGVDIFFVVSGFLMQKLHPAGSTATSFYTRRARRLLPAYFATVFATVLAAAFITLPIEFGQVSEQALFASFFASNFGFWAQNSYFAKEQFNPLLHLWSLGAEIQFYLLFPLIAWACRGRSWLLWLVIIGSLGLCFALMMVSPKTAFFMMPARLWQFGLGMMAANWTGKTDSRIGLAGLVAMIAIPFVPLSVDQSDLIWGHPGLAAVAISIGAALALANPLSPILVASRIGLAAQRLGNISYSLYLAHWPALVLLLYVPFGGTVNAPRTPPQFVVAALLIAAFTILLYRAFEKPGPKMFTVRRSVVAASVLLVVGFASAPIQMKRFSPADQQIFRGYTDRAVYRCGKLVRIIAPQESLCAVSEGRRTIFLIGDSHSDAIKTTFADVAGKAGFRTYFSVDNAPLIGGKFDIAWLVEQARRRKPERVYFHYAPSNLDASKIIEASRALEALGIETILIAPVPVYRNNVLLTLYLRHKGIPAEPSQNLWDYGDRNGQKLAALERDGIRIIQAAPSICTPKCRIQDPTGAPAYFDDGHLTLSGARMLREKFEKDFSRK